MTTTKIHGITVTSDSPYILYGSVRDLVAECDTLAEVRTAHQADRDGCAGLGGGAYSDARIYSVGDDWHFGPLSDSDYALLEEWAEEAIEAGAEREDDVHGFAAMKGLHG